MLKTKTKMVKYGSEFSKAILIPASIRKDSAYPFSDDEQFEIEIKGMNLIIKKIPKKKD